MRYLLPLALLLFSTLLPEALCAAQVRYVSDVLYVPLRSGPGNDYRITHSGLPTGTRLELLQTSEDDEFARVRTGDGDTGWLRNQYLMDEPPAAMRLEEVRAQLDRLEQSNSELRTQRNELVKARDALEQKLQETRGSLNAVSDELVQLKQISGNAMQLDADNQRLMEEVELLRAEMETLEAENQRLEDKLNNEAFINGALAVLLGVIITLVVPRLWPRRRNTDWA